MSAGIGTFMEPTYHNHDVALIQETGFDYDSAAYAVVCNEQIHMKEVYRDDDGLRRISINKSTKTSLSPVMTILGLLEKS